MATLKLAQASLTDEASREETPFIPNHPETKYSEEPPYYVFKLVKKQKRVYVDGICHNVKNPNTGNYETMWLIRGAHSIWESDLGSILKDIDKPNSRVNKNRMSLFFEDGIMRIRPDQRLDLEYARRHSFNVGKNRHGGGKYDFYEYNPEEEQKWRLEKQLSKVQLIQQISLMKEDAMLKLAYWFNISPHDNIGLKKSPDGIREELLLVADSRPDDVKKYLGSKEVEVAHLVRKAIIEAMIDLTSQNGNAIWANGKGFIAKIPRERKPYEYLTELAMTNSEEGRQFKEQLESIVT